MLKLKGQGQVLWRFLPVVQFAFRLVGRGWNHFYGWMLDRQEQRNTIHTILKRAAKRQAPGKDMGLYDLSRGVYHADYLFRHGLKPAHRILDIGCGFGRTGIPLIKRMDKGTYVGVELSAERIRLAREWTALEGLEPREPRWIVAFDNTLPYLADGEIDCVWAQSVLTHMPEDEIRVLLPAVRRVLKPGGTMLFNFTLSPDGSPHRSSVKDYQYPAALMTDLCRTLGFGVEVLDDWQDDLDPDSRALHNMMLKLRKADA
jgi:ubiquinone/menaquinone biosynthesis C-methylase UbiE